MAKDQGCVLKQMFLMSDDDESRMGMRVQFEGSHEKSTDFPADVGVVQLLGMLGKSYQHQSSQSVTTYLQQTLSSINPI